MDDNNLAFFTAQLKTGEIVKKPIEDLDEFMEKNFDNIQPQYKKMRPRFGITANSK